MTEQPPKVDSLLGAARKFIDSEFLSHVDPSSFKVRSSHIRQNTEIIPELVRNIYQSHVGRTEEHFLDSGKALERDATNLALVKLMDERSPIAEREITLFDELSLFRNSLIAEINTAVQNIKSHIEDQGKFEDISYLNDFINGDIKSLNRLTIIETALSRSTSS